GHQNRILHFAITVDPDAGGKHAVQDPAPGHEAARADYRIHGQAHAPAFLRKHELRRRLLRRLGPDGPALVVKIELRHHVHQILFGSVLAVQSSYIAPIARLLGIDVVEIVSDHAVALEVLGKDIFPKIMSGSHGPARLHGAPAAAVRYRTRKCPSTRLP